MKNLSILIMFLSIFLTSCGCRQQQDNQQDLKTWVEVIPEVINSVAYIEIRDYMAEIDFAIPIASGSGFVVNSAGFVATNYHVVSAVEMAEYVPQIVIKFQTGQSFLARKVYAYPEYDLAIIMIDAIGLPSLGLSTETLKVGQPVIAFGSRGNLLYSASDGMVSHIDRLNEDKEEGFEWIQTTATIYPGFSGGPVINLKGEVVGINNAYPISQPIFSLIIPVHYLIYIIETDLKPKLISEGLMQAS